MSTSIEPVLPRTANLLACKQWWRVCFLYGDQQKYYRQVYSKAAAQRLALSNKTKKAVATTEAETSSTAPPPLFPKQTIPSSQRRTKKLLKSLRTSDDNHDDEDDDNDDDHNNNRSTISKEPSKKKNEEVTNNAAKVTILDDPFLFGIDDVADISPSQLNEATEQYIKTYFDGSTSTTIDSLMQLPELQPKSTATLDRHCISSRHHDLQISENDLKFLNLTLRKRPKGGSPTDSKNFTSINDISFTFNDDSEITE